MSIGQLKPSCRTNFLSTCRAFTLSQGFARNGMSGRLRSSPARQIIGLGAALLITASPAVALSSSNDTAGGSDDQPPGFDYTHLWTDADGVTHIKECQMKGFELKEFADGGAQQYVRTAGGNPQKVSFTQLKVDNVNPYHNCPGTQFVAVMKGSWYVKTSDGTKRVFQPGEVMFQDNSKDSPAKNSPEHESGTVGSEPCNQMVIQVDRCPEVDNPCPF